MELDREQIIKALECCSPSGKHCTECVYFYRAVDGICAPYLMADALALIKELTEENEAISERYAIQVVTAIELDKQVQRLTKENERLRAELEQRPPKLIITKKAKKKG